jgi:hypothetical protein
MVGGDHRWFAAPYRIRAFKNMVVALKHRVDLEPKE